MLNGKKIIYQDIAYMRKNHFCPVCKGKVDVVTVSRVVDADSKEAEQFDFSLSRKTDLVGQVEFHYKEFECRECEKHYTLAEMKKIEGIQERPRTPSSRKDTMIRDLKVILFLVFAALISAVIDYFLK